MYLYLNEKNLDKILLIDDTEIKQGTGIIKDNQEKREYSIRELMKLSITESDNTAYVKLVNYVGKEKLQKFGNDIGALNTMKGKPTDCFGIKIHII